MTSIVYDYTSVAHGLRQLEGKPSAKLSLPPGIIIMMASEYRPDIRMPASVKAGFVLQISSSRATLSLVHIHDRTMIREAVRILSNHLVQEFPTLNWVGDQLLMAVTDGQRLEQRLHELSQH